MAHRTGQRLEWSAKGRIPRQRERAHRVAVIGAVEGYELAPAGVFARGLERALDRLGAAVGEVHAAEARRQQSGEAPGQRDLRFDHVLAVNHHMQMTAHLGFDRAQHRRMAVAERGDGDSRDEIEVAFAVGGVEPRTLRANDFETERRIRGLREKPAKESGQEFGKGFGWTAHRATKRSSNAPTPWRHSSGGDCISPGAARYDTPILLRCARASESRPGESAIANASSLPAAGSRRPPRSARLRNGVT